MEACLEARSHDAESRASDRLDGISGGSLLNIRHWVDLPMLLSWIEAETERFIPLRPSQPLPALNASDRFRRMLGVLCLAYSTALPRSSDIAEACRREPEFRSIAGAFNPFVDEVKNFRRRNRQLLEVVLVRLFMRVALLNAEFAQEVLWRGLESRAAEVLNLSRHLDSCDDC